MEERGWRQGEWRCRMNEVARKVARGREGGGPDIQREGGEERWRREGWMRAGGGRSAENVDDERIDALDIERQWREARWREARWRKAS